MKTTEYIKEHDICIFYKNNKILILRYEGIRDNNYVFIPVYESAEIIHDEILLHKNTVNTCIFIRDNYDYWTDDVKKAYTDYQIRMIKDKMSRVENAKAAMQKKYDHFMHTKEYDMIYNANKDFSRALDKIKELIQTYGKVKSDT